MTDLRHFPRVVREYRENDEGMSRIGVSLAITAIAMLTVTAHTMAFQDELMEQAAKQVSNPAEEQAKHYSSVVAHCMNGQVFTWKDPHTGETWAIFCDRQMISRPL